MTETVIDAFAPSAKIPGAETVLFVGIFPFFFGALAIFEKRKKELIGNNWIPLLFRGVPKIFGTVFYAFFYAVWLLCVYLMVRQKFQKAEWPDLGLNVRIGFALVPSVFYLVSAGAYWYWSAAAESSERNKNERQVQTLN